MHKTGSALRCASPFLDKAFLLRESTKRSLSLQARNFHISWSMNWQCVFAKRCGSIRRPAYQRTTPDRWPDRWALAPLNGRLHSVKLLPPKLNNHANTHDRNPTERQDLQPHCPVTQTLASLRSGECFGAD